MRPAARASLRMDRSTTARILADRTILDAVLAITEAVHQLHQSEAVAEKLFTGIMELIPADRGAGADTTVPILGESGTGK